MLFCQKVGRTGKGKKLIEEEAERQQEYYGSSRYPSLGPYNNARQDTTDADSEEIKTDFETDHKTRKVVKFRH
jgi:hypothetical protein